MADQVCLVRWYPSQKTGALGRLLYSLYSGDKAKAKLHFGWSEASGQIIVHVVNFIFKGKHDKHSYLPPEKKILNQVFHTEVILTEEKKSNIKLGF